jgi:hypothetical protein
MLLVAPLLFFSVEHASAQAVLDLIPQDASLAVAIHDRAFFAKKENMLGNNTVQPIFSGSRHY